jgi:hypothetical protein
MVHTSRYKTMEIITTFTITTVTIHTQTQTTCGNRPLSHR